MSGWIDKAEALEDIYNDLDLDCLQELVNETVGEDQAEEVVGAISNLDFEMRDTIRRLFAMACAEDARAADGAEGR
ncbi:hypothetical protein JI75_02485 [Berryella intestinalis]|uniref:Uncharacterized protein n=1 Tax=Berryella intestinalis TaxID=1531429 RepID=A0A0A8B9A9_9ACTN|nr:hypothetical protein [Berryella intestinalis]AJC11707.1 hypothetical protein JI75_02485 [Berryella intestinalis]